MVDITSAGSEETLNEKLAAGSEERLKERLATAEERVRQIESDRDEKLSAARNQLQEAKEKAKQLFLTRATKFQKQVSDLEEAARARDAENSALKSLVREADTRVEDADKRASVAEERLAGIEEVVRAAVDDAVAVVGKERDEARAALVLKTDEAEKARLAQNQAEEEAKSFRDGQSDALALLEKALLASVGFAKKDIEESCLHSDATSLEQPLESAASTKAGREAKGAEISTPRTDESSYWTDRFATTHALIAKVNECLGNERSASMHLQFRTDKLQEEVQSLQKALADQEAGASVPGAATPVLEDSSDGENSASGAGQLSTLRAEKDNALREGEEVRAMLSQKNNVASRATRATAELEDDLRLKEEEHEKLLGVVKKLRDAAEVANERIVELEKRSTSEKTLATEKLASNTSASTKEMEHANRRIDELEKSNLSLSRDLADARDAQAKEAAELAASSKSVSLSSTRDDSRVLEAKVTELERLLAAKNAEIGKVREKARSYLKDMNSEKKEMEARLRGSMSALERRLATEQASTDEAKQEAERTVQELDSCLTVIGEKQKSVQALNMALASERSATKAAHLEAEKTALEFDAYKERARLALEERDRELESASDSIDAATADLKEELREAVLDSQELRKALADSRQEEAKMSDAADRAAKAEASLELIRSDMSLAFSNSAGRVETLEEEAESLRKQLSASESACSNAESRVSTALVRLEVSERALHAAELAAKENARVAETTVGQLREQVLTLEKTVCEANASAAAAQRTAAVAARAMAYTSLDDESNAVSGSQLYNSPSIQSELASASSLPPPPASPAAAATSRAHSDGPYADSTSFYETGGGSGTAWKNDSAGDVASRDDQIAVLMSQISELGALLADVREEYACREQQVVLLKSEVRSLDSKLAAADKLSDGTPFELLRTTVLHYMRTGDSKLLPVLAQVLGISEEEMMKVREAHSSAAGSVGDTATYFPSFMRR